MDRETQKLILDVMAGTPGAFTIILILMQYRTWPQILFHLKHHGVVGAELWRMVKDDYDDNVSQFVAEQLAQMKPKRAHTLRALARQNAPIYN